MAAVEQRVKHKLPQGTAGRMVQYTEKNPEIALFHAFLDFQLHYDCIKDYILIDVTFRSG